MTRRSWAELDALENKLEKIQADPVKLRELELQAAKSVQDMFSETYPDGLLTQENSRIQS